jgi:hypothetical protein
LSYLIYWNCSSDSSLYLSSARTCDIGIVIINYRVIDDFGSVDNLNPMIVWRIVSVRISVINPVARQENPMISRNVDPYIDRKSRA